MRYLCVIGLCLCLAAGFAAAGESPAVTRARQEMDRIQQLVDAGAMPRIKLDQAKESFSAAQDEDVLARTLYGQLGVEDLTEDQTREMLNAAKRQVERRRKSLDAAKKLVEEGALARTSLLALLEDFDRSRKTVDMAESRARLFEELMAMARAELEAQMAALAEPAPEPERLAAERYDGSGIFTQVQMRQVILAFEREFAKPLPISARGETAFHRSLGYDHRGRIDVPLHPDDKEGAWLRRYLESERIPYFAFRKSIPGSATAAHIHIGPPSTRLRVAD